MRTVVKWGRIATIILVSALSSSAQSKHLKQLGVTYWFGTDSGGKTFVLELHDSGAVRFLPETGVISKGTWQHRGTSVEIELNGKFVTLAGGIEASSMIGIAKTKKGAQWSWSATEQPPVIATAAPSYPPLAKAAMVGGAVFVDVEIDSAGVVTSIQSIRGHPLLREVSREAAKRYRFLPNESVKSRTARLTFLFRETPVNDKATEPLILSPYQIAIRRGPVYIERSYFLSKDKP